jgi:hypothetical protein
LTPVLSMDAAREGAPAENGIHGVSRVRSVRPLD